MRVVRGISGIVAGGVVALALLVVAVGLVGWVRDFPGPGGAAMVWHIAAAAVVLFAQRRVDRGRGAAGVGAAVLVVGVAVALLWTQWWR